MRSITLLSGLLLLVAAVASRADEPPAELQAELNKLQGLWQDHLGGAEHRNGEEVVRQPVHGGPCFFICGDRLIWLTDDGQPSGREERLTLDIKTDPKRITRTLVLVDGKKVAAAPVHGIYEVTESGLRVQFGLDGGPAPRRFLVGNKPDKEVDGQVWLISRKKLGEK